MKIKKHLFSAKADFGLLMLRLTAGGMMFWFHGKDKLINFGDKMDSFRDPIGLGSEFSLGLAVFAEVFCALAVVIGLLTRLTAIPLVILLLTAAFVVHGDDPWSKQEFALVYAIPFFALIFTGAGKYSVDNMLR